MVTSRRRILRAAEAAALLGLLLAGSAGCTDPANGRTAEHTLELAAAGLEGVDRYGFRVKTAVATGGAKPRELESFEGEIVGHSKLRIRNAGGSGATKAAEMAAGKAAPAVRLAELQRMDKAVTYAKPEKSGVLTLRVELTAEAAKRDAASRIRARFDRAAQAAMPKSADPKSVHAKADPNGPRTLPRANGSDGADSSALTYDEAVKQEIERSRRELDGMLDSLAAETVVLVTVDRSSLLPLRLSETAVLRYEAGGRQREEKNMTNVEFANFDGRP